MITLTLGTSSPASSPRAAGKALSRSLSPFAKVEPHEAVSAVAVFSLLTSYYLLETAREPILLHGQSLLLLAVTPAYALARRVVRVRLLLCVYAFVPHNLIATLVAPHSGFVFLAGQLALSVQVG